MTKNRIILRWAIITAAGWLALTMGQGRAAAQGLSYSGTVLATFPPGGVVPAASIRVCTEPATGTPCTPLATIYSDPQLQNQLPNPFPANSQGFYTFYAGTGVYHVQVSGPNVAVTDIPYIYLGNAAPPLPFDNMTFSAMPVFNAGAFAGFGMTLTGNVTSSSITGAVTGQVRTFIITQDATGGRTFAWPSNVVGPPTVNAAANAVTTAVFIFDGSNWQLQPNQAPFSSVTSGTNTGQSLVVGNGSTLSTSGTGSASITCSSCTLSGTTTNNGTISGGAVNPRAVWNTMFVDDFGATGNGTTNDTTAVTNAAQAAAAAGAQLVFSPGKTYAVCSVSLTTSGPVLWYGDGSAEIVRHSSCLQQASDMVLITATGSAPVIIDGMRFDQLGNGTTFSNSAIHVIGAQHVWFENNYVAHGQANGFQCDAGSSALGSEPCQDIHLSGNTFYEDWWFGATISSGGNTTTPVPTIGVVATGNHYINTTFGLGLNFYVQDFTVTGEEFNNSGLGLIQMANAYGTVSGININGSSSYGYGAPGDGIFMEGVSGVKISGVNIQGLASGAYGIECIGSDLQLGSGPTVQLPCANAAFDDITIDTPNTGVQPFLISAWSFDHSIYGNQISLSNIHIANSRTCPTVDHATNVSVTNSTCDTTQVGGYELGDDQRFFFSGNSAHNIGSGSSGSYDGLAMGSGDLDGDVYDNTFVNDNGTYLMHYGVEDVSLESSTASQIRHWGNIVRGTLSDQWHPVPAIPALGTWSAGDKVENFSSGGGWIATAGGTPGTWALVPTTSAPSSLSGSVSIATPGTAGNCTASATTITGATTAMVFSASPAGTRDPDAYIGQVWVSAANTVYVEVCAGSSSGSPPTIVYNVRQVP